MITAPHAGVPVMPIVTVVKVARRTEKVRPVASPLPKKDNRNPDDQYQIR